MNKQDKQALAELTAYLASRTEDSNRVSDRHYIAAHTRISNETHRKQHQAACATKRDNTYQAQANAKSETKARISQAMKGRKKTTEHEAKVAASNRAKPNDPNWRAALMAGLAKRDRPFHAGPYGVFPSLTAAARHVMEQGLLTNAVKKFEKWKKTDPANYYFIER
jgi:hypothetical protein